MANKYNFDVNLSTERYTIEIDTAESYGYFQDNTTGTEGGLWFDGMELVDYDGVAVLPKQVEDALKANGYSLDDDEEAAA